MVISASVLPIYHSGSMWILQKSYSLTMFMMLLIFSVGYVLEKRPGQNLDVQVSNFVVRAEFQKFSNR